MSVKLPRPSVAVIVFAVSASMVQMTSTKIFNLGKGGDKEDVKKDSIWPLKFPLKTISLIKDLRCYRGVGCFRKNDKYRLTHPLSLPKRPRYVRTKFYIYSRNSTSGRRLRTRFLRRDGKLFFRELKDLIILAHGYTQSVNSSWLHDLKEVLLQEKDCNVVIVDWGRGCRSPMYLTAVGNTALVGRQISLLVQKLSKTFGRNVTASRVHLVGFSLGAQVCGFAGRHYKKQTGTKLARISALDAARPLFEQSQVHVTRTDAVFVDAIHTSSGWTVLQKALGMGKPVGHVDFYPNGGRNQPGCGGLLEIDCDHGRAPLYYIESIKYRQQCRFVTYMCQGGMEAFRNGICVSGKPSGEMGYYSIQAPGRGLQFLKTNAHSPFCLPLNM
ncbi:phospholipase A1-like [Dermacentor andersoni]|uniref:phospholipase A1-like n=1 Tax=Dermacentor andersoni TaxID=34620 RepID=UPI0021553F0D|nr:phospholipase A1-like [Dermacentor andersoni]